MAGRFGKRFELPADDLQQLMACVVEHAEPHEARDVERVLGLLSSLTARAGAADEQPVSFVAPQGTAHLVERALNAMTQPDRRSTRRSPASA